MMENSHRANVLVTSCLKTPVDPQTKTPVALYERERNAEINDEKQKEYDSESNPAADAGRSKVLTPLPLDLREFCFSNVEYYHKLEQLRSAYLQTMAELDLMYRKNLDLKDAAPLSSSVGACRMQWDGPNLLTGEELNKAHSVLDLDNEKIVDGNDDTEKVLHEHIRNMWKDFTVGKSLSQNQKHDRQTLKKPNAQVQRPKKGRRSQEGGWRPQVTVPKPFQMTLRDAEIKRKGMRSRSEIERENEELHKQLEELMECQRKFRASPVPAQVHLPLYEELRERDEERRRHVRAAEQQRLPPRPFGFLEREKAKKEQKEALLQEQKEQEKQVRCPFRAKPVPRAVKEAALGERQKEEQLYREIKKHMRATEMLLSASTPPSTLAKRLAERRLRKADQVADEGNRQPRTNSQVPDFDASHRRFKEQLESKCEFRPVTACEPFNLSTANTASRKERYKVEPRSPRTSRWQFVASSPQTPSSSVCSSLSGSLEYLPSKITDAAKKRQDAVRKVLEERKKAEEEEETWKKKQKQRERKLQKLIARRAQANDPHVTLAQACQSKLKEFRKQDLQRRKEYRDEMREIQERVKSRPLLLERVAQMNAKRAAERHYAEALCGCGLSEAFVNSKAPSSTLTSSSERRPSSTSRDSQRVLDPVADDLVDPDDLAEADSECSLPGDYPADYEDYEPDVEDQSVDSENESQDEKERQREDHKSDPDKELDDHPYEDDPNFADADDDGDKSDRNNTSGESDDGKSPPRDGERTEDEKSRQSSQASSSEKETGEKEESDEED